MSEKNNYRDISQDCTDNRGNPASRSGQTASRRDGLNHFSNMIDNCYEYACRCRSKGLPIVGIMCEYTPRELIMAAEGVPVLLCGGSAETIPSAEKYLPANICPLIKSTYGYAVQKTNPFLEMASLAVAENTCDGKKKMYELLSRHVPVYVLDLPQKSDNRPAFDYWLGQLYEFKDELEKRFDVEINFDTLHRAVRVMNCQRQLKRRLAESMTAELPPFSGRQLLDFKSIISGIPADMQAYRQLIDTAGENGSPWTGKEPRVLLTGVPIVHGAERIMDIIESNGGAVVCIDNCTGIKPALDDIDESAANLDELMEAIARKYLSLSCSVMTPNQRRFEILERLASQYNVDCVIELVWSNCITYDVEAARIQRFVRDKLGLGYLKISTDYSPADSARLGLRIQALFETI